MRYFEQVVLVSEDGQKTIIERKYSDGTVEYWSVMTISFHNGGAAGQAQFPFKIDVRSRAYPMDHLPESREEAFANFDAAFSAARPVAEAELQQKMEMAARRQKSKIVLANALPPMQ